MDEHWEDSNDPDFTVSMTPECSEDCEKEFETQDDFWNWYDGEVKIIIYPVQRNYERLV
jgi:hypothetical protein